MQITSKKPEEFTPFNIDILFETEEEAINFYNIFNHTYVVESFGCTKYAGKLREAIRESFPSIVGKYHKSFGESSDLIRMSFTGE